MTCLLKKAYRKVIVHLEMKMLILITRLCSSLKHKLIHFRWKLRAPSSFSFYFWVSKPLKLGKTSLWEHYKPQHPAPCTYLQLFGNQMDNEWCLRCNENTFAEAAILFYLVFTQLWGICQICFAWFVTKAQCFCWWGKAHVGEAMCMKIDPSFWQFWGYNILCNLLHW